MRAVLRTTRACRRAAARPRPRTPAAAAIRSGVTGAPTSARSTCAGPVRRRRDAGDRHRTRDRSPGRRPPRLRRARTRSPSARSSRTRPTARSDGTRIGAEHLAGLERRLHEVREERAGGDLPRPADVRRCRARRRARGRRAASRPPGPHARGCRRSCPCCAPAHRRCAARSRSAADTSLASSADAPISACVVMPPMTIAAVLLRDASQLGDARRDRRARAARRAAASSPGSGCALPRAHGHRRRAAQQRERLGKRRGTVIVERGRNHVRPSSDDGSDTASGDGDGDASAPTSCDGIASAPTDPPPESARRRDRPRRGGSRARSSPA